MGKSWLVKMILNRKKQKITVLDRVLFGILGAGFVLLIVFFAYLLWFVLTNRSVIYFLPAEKTVAYFQLEDLTLPPKISQENLFDLIGVSAILQNSFGMDTKDLKDNLTQGRMGLALVKTDNGDKLLLFFRSRSKSGAIKYFESLGIKGEKLTTVGEKKDIIYTYPQSRSFSFSFIGPYLFLSQDMDALKLIQSVNNELTSSLHDDPYYQKSLANLPRDAWGNGYINIQALRFESGNPLNNLVDPLKKIINHFALTIRKQQNGFHFNSLLSIDQSLLSLNKGYVDSTRFAYSLADFIGSKNIAAYIGGANLTDEWENTLDTISNLNPAYGLILEGIVNAQLGKIFGDDVSLRDDIYPLFEGEYALVFEDLAPADSSSAKLGIKLLLKHSDSNFAKIKLARLMEGYKALAAQFAPKLKVVTLPDGTESKELVADPTKLNEESETYKDYDIECTTVTESTFGFCYTVTDSLIILSNSIDSIKETLDLSITPKYVLSQSQSFRQALSNLSAISDEITYVSLDNANALLKNTTVGVVTDKLLSPFEAVTWIKHYFNDGVSTEGYLLLK
jgi:hypothetical protein